jgi:hypothetical protein
MPKPKIDPNQQNFTPPNGAAAGYHPNQINPNLPQQAFPSYPQAAPKVQFTTPPGQPNRNLPPQPYPPQGNRQQPPYRPSNPPYPPYPPQQRPPAGPNPQQETERLRKMDPNRLRREVVTTEIEIERTLLESEKAYREGVSTVRDLIAPSSIKINTGSLEVGTKVVRTFFVLTYPRVINSGWLEGIDFRLSTRFWPSAQGIKRKGR